MPGVTVIDYTGNGHPLGGRYAAYILTFTKSTRLNMSPGNFAEWLEKPWSEIEDELRYMAKTIPSSWEFADMTFIIENVTRAGAQQITRTRFTPMETDMFGAYAMQSQRVTDMTGVTYPIPKGINIEQRIKYREVMETSLKGYKELVDIDMPLEDARGVLPMNSHCNLVAKYNLRMLSELFRKRESLRVQGEFQEIVRRMRVAVLEAWPWAEDFFIPKDKLAIDIIEEVAKGLPRSQAMELAKAADLLKVP